MRTVIITISCLFLSQFLTANNLPNNENDSIKSNLLVISGARKLDAMEIESAKYDLAKAISLNPKNGMAYYHRGMIKVIVGDYKGAMNDFIISKKLAPKNELVYLEIAFIEWTWKKYDKALKEIEIVLKINPNNAEAHYYKGAITHDVKGGQNGCVDYRKSMELGYEMKESDYCRFCKCVK